MNPIPNPTEPCKPRRHRASQEPRGPVDRSAISRFNERQISPTEAEVDLWRALLRSSIVAGIRRKARVHGCVVDFFIPTRGIVIEVDPTEAAERTEYDRCRTRHLLESGLTVLRYTDDQVEHSLEAVVDEIARHAAP